MMARGMVPMVEPLGGYGYVVGGNPFSRWTLWAGIGDGRFASLAYHIGGVLA